MAIGPIVTVFYNKYVICMETRNGILVLGRINRRDSAVHLISHSVHQALSGFGQGVVLLSDSFVQSNGIAFWEGC